MKKIILLLLGFSMASCAQTLPTLTQVKELTQGTPSGSIDIASGLKQALNKGITEQVEKLTVVDGFYKNDLVKILLPPDLQKVDATLRKMGLSSLADEGIKVMNRAAEEAVKEATPIFVNAITTLSFTDAKTILLGNDTAATSYLEKTTSTALYSKFSPIVKSSFDKVGADKVWNNIITKYNSLPLTKDINPDLTDYVTDEAMVGVFKMIAIEEIAIRTNLNTRTTPLLKKVFALQDKK